LLERSMHLDPDFEYLTYGDEGSRRGAGMVDMSEGDLLVYYGGLRPVYHCEHKLIYALMGDCSKEVESLRQFSGVVKAIRGNLATCQLLIALQIQSQPPAQRRLGSYPVHRLLHLPHSAVAAFHGVGGRSQ
jgi:hypothetical protein